MLRNGRVAMLSLLAGSCSVAIDADRAQCASDRDCDDRGGAFAGSVCVAGECQAVDDACDGGSPCKQQPQTSALKDACVGTGCPSKDASRDARSDARAAPPSEEPDPPSEDLPDAAVETPPDRERQCVEDQDCAARGLTGWLCVDQVCWQPPAANECTTALDCTARGPEFIDGMCLDTKCRPNPRWRCERPVPPNATEPLTLHILVRDSLSLSPLSDVHAFVCQKLDLDCVEPVTEATTGRDGMLALEVPHDLAGYLRLEHPRFNSALYFLPAVLPSDGQLQPAPLLGVGVIDALGLAIGSTLDPERGHMMLISEDCLGTALEGVTFESPQEDDTTIQFYVRDLLPSPSATETGDVGNGGYVNFPAGLAVIEVTAKELGLKLTTVSVSVRPKFITVAYIRPDLR